MDDKQVFSFFYHVHYESRPDERTLQTILPTSTCSSFRHVHYEYCANKRILPTTNYSPP
jgi:hypothetical protein